MICSELKLDGEVGFITETLCNNGFPEGIVRSVIGDKMAHFLKTESVQRCISDDPGWVRLVIDLPIRFLHVYGGVTLPLIYVLCIANVLFCHQVVKMFSPTPT